MMMAPAEQQSVKAAVVSALHHSRDVGLARRAALQGQKKTTEGEEVDNATHGGHGPVVSLTRGRSGVTVRHSVGEAPALSPPSLADAAADTVDHSSLAFLLKSRTPTEEG